MDPARWKQTEKAEGRTFEEHRERWACRAMGGNAGIDEVPTDASLNDSDREQLLWKYRFFYLSITGYPFTVIHGNTY